ncbi:MAG TPA: HAD-IA family hydrolase [Bacteroidales bacterium]|nr:HAD-IA family hydrolase [Bacteroidales bacterium]HPI68208.1 HAD-IA family hydrolase [Bacteroidales bacterium]HPR72590.1 HAD-IA family hydrolase [Bacteroidales bacterium]
MAYDIQPNIKGLIFDLDGTLANTMPYHFLGWKLASNKFGVDMDKTFLRKLNGSAGKIIASELIRQFRLENVTIEQLIEEKLYQFNKIQHEVKPIEPVVNIVKKYHGVLPMAVGTGGHRKAVERTLEITGLRQYFDIIVTSNDVTNYKPHPETFLKCAEMMKVNPEFIQVFEDGNLGLEAARTAGMIATDVRSWYNSDW